MTRDNWLLFWTTIGVLLIAFGAAYAVISAGT